VHEGNGLQLANSFRDTAQVLLLTRAGVAWMTTGCACRPPSMRWPTQRNDSNSADGRVPARARSPRPDARQRNRLCVFGVGLSQMQEQGHAKDHHAAWAKAFCTVRMRETVGRARGLLGGNDILLDQQCRQVRRRFGSPFAPMKAPARSTP
jgi:glutaryl-CoA dehydrogenase